MPTRFDPVPKSPNCVSSRAHPDDRAHHVHPIRADLDAIDAHLATWPRTKLVAQHEGYRHYTCKTKLLGFVDDLELEQDGDVVHVRSASRLGYGDFGVNRKRVERIRAAVEKA